MKEAKKVSQVRDNNYLQPNQMDPRSLGVVRRGLQRRKLGCMWKGVWVASAEKLGFYHVLLHVESAKMPEALLQWTFQWTFNWKLRHNWQLIIIFESNGFQNIFLTLHSVRFLLLGIGLFLPYWIPHSAKCSRSFQALRNGCCGHGW